MALWWNGSEWKTTSTLWKDVYSTGNNQVGIGITISIVAYEDLTIKMTVQIGAYQTASIYHTVTWDGTLTFKSGSTTIGTNTFSNKNITSYSSISYSGTLYAYGGAGANWYSSGGLSFSGSTSIASPFRTITYNVNQGTGSPGTQKLLKGANGKVTPAETPTRSGYTFAGWNTEADGSGTAYSNGSTISINSNTTLYAQWATNNYNVNINAGEGVVITFDGETFTNENATVSRLFGKSCAYTVTAAAGFILKSASPAESGTISISTSNPTIKGTAQHVGCRVDDGNDWVQSLIYVDDGNDWVMCQAYYDDGNQWTLLN